MYQFQESIESSSWFLASLLSFVKVAIEKSIVDSFPIIYSNPK